jgi:predicted GIY-YIG superfamily endonuclease
MQHNAGKTRSLRGAIPVRLVHQETFRTLVEARRRELYLKKLKSHSYLESLIESARTGG